MIEEVLHHLRTATDTAPGWAKSWHHWGLFNLALLGHHAAAREPAKAQAHVAPAVVGFFRSVALGQSEGARRPEASTAPGLRGCRHPDAPAGSLPTAASCAACLLD